MSTAQVFEIAGTMNATAFFQALAREVFEVEDGAEAEATDIFGDAVADAAEETDEPFRTPAGQTYEEWLNDEYDMLREIELDMLMELELS